MKRIPQGRYSKEFHEEAVKHVTEQGLSAPEASKRLDIPKSTLSYWIKSSKAGNLGRTGRNSHELTDTGLDIAKLKRELAKVQIKRDTLFMPFE